MKTGNTLITDSKIKYNVVQIEFDELHPNQYMEGFYIVLNKDKQEIVLSELDNDGFPLYYKDGGFTITSRTGVNNSNVKETNAVVVKDNDDFTLIIDLY